MWLVLAATLQAALIPLLHDHANGHGTPAQQRVSQVQDTAAVELAPALAALQPGAAGPAAAFGETPTHTETGTEAGTDACAVCAHFAGTCMAIVARYAAAFLPVRVAPPRFFAQALAPLQHAWVLPASRAPPFFSAAITSAFAA